MNLLLQDGVFLATLLSNPAVTAHDIPKVLTVYDAIRRPFATDVSRRSHLNGAFYTLNHPEYKHRFSGPVGSGVEQMQFLKEYGEALKRNWEWAWTTSFNDSMESGMVMLKKIMTSSESSYGATAVL